MTPLGGAGDGSRKKKTTIHIPVEGVEGAPSAGTAARGAKDAAHGAAESAPLRGEFSQAPEPDPRDAQTEVETESAGTGRADRLAETVNHLQRLQAEFENYRRRTERERLETAGRAQADLIDRILPVIDDLDRAADAVEDPDSPTVKGFLLVRDKLHRLLADAGLEKIPATGADFDPNLHEALLTEPVEADLAGKVLDELVAGYRYQGRVVRPARVKVGMEGSE